VTTSAWVCIPTYNERDNIDHVVHAVRASLDQLSDVVGHILVIDDNSPDGTGALAQALADADPHVHVLHRATKEGLGKAYLAGFVEALAQGADLVLEMDADLSHDPHDVPRLIRAALGRDGSAGADLVLGSRYVPGGGVQNWPWHRQFVSKGGSLYARTLLGVGIRDLTGGFKCFRRDLLTSLDLSSVESHGYTFQIEMTVRALRAGWRVVEIPIVFSDRIYGESKMTGSIIREAMIRTWSLRRRTFRDARPPARSAPPSAS
jgi:dolichol-phosphate mannosyltransferase